MIGRSERGGIAMDWDFVIGATIMTIGAWALAGMVIILARREAKRRANLSKPG